MDAIALTKGIETTSNLLPNSFEENLKLIRTAFQSSDISTKIDNCLTMVTLYLDNAKSKIDEKNFDELEMISQKLSHVALILGNEELLRNCFTLQLLARQSDTELARETLDEMCQDFSQFQMHLDSIRHELNV